MNDTVLSETVLKLVERCLAGEQSAMVNLVDMHKGQVFGLCLRMLRHREDAEDAAQETFVRMLKSLHRWDQARDFLPWLLAIAGNRCRTVLSKRMRTLKTQTIVEPIPDREPDMQAAQNLSEEVQLALDKVRVEYKEAFLLFHHNELSYDQIAESLGRPVGTIKTWIHRARRELIEQLRRREVVTESRYAV